MRKGVFGAVTLLFFLILVTPVITADQQYCVVETGAPPPIESVNENSCYAVIDSPEDSLADQGYCCSIPGGDETAEEGGDQVTRAYCNNISGSFTTDDYDTRAAACQDGSFTTTFQGYVTNASDDTLVQGANVTVTYGNIGNTTTNTTSTDENGFYNVTLYEPTNTDSLTLSIEAQKNLCSKEVAPPPSSTQNNVSICEDNDESDPEDEDNRCGNGVINGDEECEVTADGTIYANDIAEGTRTCDAQNCVAYVDDEESDLCENDDSTVCQPITCGDNPNMPLSTSSIIKETTVDITVTWSHNVSCDPQETEINITGPDGFEETAIIESTSHTFTFNKDRFKDGETTDDQYTVRAQSQFTHTTASNQTTVTPKLICDGRAEESFCYTDNNDETGVMMCDEQGNAIDFNACNGTAVCSQQTPKSARCRQNVCESCRGPYDLFSSEVLYTPVPGQSDLDQCSTYFQDNVCYYEGTSKQNTVKGQSEVCQDVKSCSDYESQQTCSANPCQKELDCDWQSLSQGLGDGYCRADDAEEVGPGVCQQCGSESCTEYLCQDFYGNISGTPGESFCYYNEDATYSDGVPQDPEYIQHRCMARPQSGCATYNQNQTQCTNGTPVQVAENNSITQPSEDFFNFGACTYDESPDIEYGCFKDADGNGQPDCLSDSTDSPFDPRCVSDFQPPNTSISGVNDGERIRQPHLNRLTFTTSDNEYEQSETTLHVAYDDNTYNDTDATVVKTNLVEDIRQAKTNTLNLTYCAEDGAHNLEVKQDFTIRTYKDMADTLNLSLAVDTFNVGATPTANLTATTGSLSYARNLTCTYDLQQTEGGSTTSERAAQNQEQTTVTFGYLDGGVYQVTTNCNDDYGFTYDETQTATIDLDNTITNTSPKYDVVSENTITLHAETNQSRTCQYNIEDDWTPFESSTDGNTTHEATVQTPENGLVTHEIRCANNTNNPTWIYGDEEDTIVYAADNTAPSINATITGNGTTQALTTQDQILQADQATIDITTTGKPDITYEDQVLNYETETGTSLQYCTGTTGNSCTISEDGETYEAPFTLTAAEDQDIVEEVTIYASDGRTNKERTYQVNLVDNSLGLSVTIEPSES